MPVIVRDRTPEMGHFLMGKSGCFGIINQKRKPADWADGTKGLVPLAELETPSGLIVEHPAPKPLHPVANRLPWVLGVACDGFQKVQLFGLVDEFGGRELIPGGRKPRRQGANEGFEGGPGFIPAKAEGTLGKGFQLRVEVVNDGTNHACPL